MSPSPDHPSAACSNLLCHEDASEVISGDLPSSSSSSSSSLPPYSPPSDDATVGRLIDVETQHMPDSDYARRCRHRLIDVTARHDSINWILKVHAYYRFRPVTAFLSVNYLDRFLSCSTLPQQSSRWPFQLLSVACLSLAAKMEEPEVPLLLELQLFEPRFFFDPKSIQRMELCVMAKLRWRLRSVTPFDYLHHFISKLPSSSTRKPESVTAALLSSSSDLIISSIRGIDFLGFAPSTMAAAAVLCSAGQSQSPPCFHDRVNKEMVRSCHQLMEEYLVDTCPSASNKSLRAEPAPPSSPIGVLDAATTCVSCDTRSENPGSSREAEPPSKRLRSSTPDVQ
ncbi:cyclin-D4-1 isoform X1 [Senna tora]|uniref:B-like cyclin n=1 Tax=Senna tora TaxID=362788 RepID=A0A834X880_9FABA|nr:cyclin-D4-1 isoform X1 [Senna tora]